MIVNNSTGGGGDSGIRDVVFRLALIEDPNNERVASNFANRVNVGPVSPLPGLNLPGGSSGSSIGPSAGGYTGRTGGGTAGSTGNYSEDMKRINEARKAAEDLITKMRVEAERKIGEERKRALEVVAKLEEEAAKKINEQKKRYDDEEQRRREKSFRDQLKWNEMVRQEREKQLRAEGAAYASRVEGGQSASYRRMGLYLQNQEDSGGRSRGSYRELIENATQLARAVVLLGVASEQSTEKIIKTLALMESGSSLVRGGIGVTNQLSEIAQSGGMRGAFGKLGLGALAVGGAALGANAIYEQVSGKSGGWNDYMGNLYANFDEQYLGGSIWGQRGTQKSNRMDMTRTLRKQANWTKQDRLDTAFGIMADSNEFETNTRNNMNLFASEMFYRNAVANNNGVRDANGFLMTNVIATAQGQGQSELDKLWKRKDTLNNRLAGSNTADDDRNMRQEILAIEQKIVEVRRNQTTIAIQGLEQMRRARLEEENAIRQMAQDKRAGFGSLERAEQSQIVRAKKKLDEGKRLTRQEEEALMQFGGQDTRQAIRERQFQRADERGFGVFMKEFEADANKQKQLANDIEKVINEQLKEIRTVSQNVAEKIVSGVDVFMKAMEENIQKKLNELGLNEKAKKAQMN